MTPLEAAHGYVKRGWPCVPLHGLTEDGVCRCRAGKDCNPKSWGKHPSLGRRWQELALVGGANVQAWWEDHPHDNVGILTGPQSGIFVLDVDGAIGIHSITTLAQERGALPPTRIVRTGSGGLHYFFKHPGHFIVRNSAGYIAAGIDIRGKDGQVVAPPSASGRGPYELLADFEVGEAPTWLLELLREHAEHLEHGLKAEVVGAAAVDLDTVPERVSHLARQTAGQMDRSSHFYALVAACYEHVFTQGQTVTIAAPWCAAVGKYVDCVEQEVARAWGKLEAESQRQNEWIPGLGDRPTKEEPWKNDDLNATDAEASTGASPTSTSASESVPNDAATAEGLEATSSSPNDPPDHPASSWDAVDLEPFLTGTYEAPQADLFPRDDGYCLLYRGFVHSFHGESESGKSMIAQAAVAQVLAEGNHAAYIDFESDPGSVINRLEGMGVTKDAMRRGFTYRRPDTDPSLMPYDRSAYGHLFAQTFDLIIIDGVTDALGVFGASTNDADEVSGVFKRFFRRIANRTGAAVVLIDHVTKNADTRGRHAVGSQAKMNALDGAAYLIEVVDQPGQGRRGELSMRVGKDRPGGVRREGVSVKDKRTSRDNTEQAARVVVDSTQGVIELTVRAPDLTPLKEVEAKRARGHMGHIKEDLCQYMLQSGEPLSQAGTIAWAKECGGITERDAKTAFNELKDSKYWRVGTTVKGHDKYVVAEPYSAAAEWVESATSATSADLGRSSAAEVVDHLGGVSIPLGDAEVDGVAHRLTSADGPAEVRAIVLVSCKGCFAPTPDITAEAFSGRCSSCARKAGLL